MTTSARPGTLNETFSNRKVDLTWYFGLFFISGFCSILYELVWLRLSMAEFGVTTAMVSTVLSVFMAGLGAGSWIAGILARRYGQHTRVPLLRFYALAEFLIGCSALAVPKELVWGRLLLASITGQGTLSSAAYYLLSGTIVALVVIPWCACMGATIPLAMAAIQNDPRHETRRSFSYLYVSNVLGAVVGAVVPLFLIELYGFHGTLHVGAVLNAVIATTAFGLTLGRPSASPSARRTEPLTDRAAHKTPQTSYHGEGALVLLFLTGLATMGMEVIWIRIYTPYIGPLVYSFASILCSYLLATFAGSAVYRNLSRNRDLHGGLLWIALALLGLLPLLTADPRIHFAHWNLLRVLLGIVPFSGVIGFLTPMLVDRWSHGDPDRAGRAYAINVAGCILGPLVAGFILLPLFGEHLSMLLFVLPWFAMALPRPRLPEGRIRFRLAAAALCVAALATFFLTRDFETMFSHREVLRDSTATAVATGTGMDKRLLTNGIGMTMLTPITKMMSHMPLASLDHRPTRVLIICFGMGTTFRSALSWGVDVTAVELVPSVPRLFPYFFGDAPQVLASPMAHIVADDGRRYLERSSQKYDAIIIDPPPPIQAAGSSLLYSEEFYAVVRDHLQPGGILQQWFPDSRNVDDKAAAASVARALKDSFPYIRVFTSVEGWGTEYLASNRPIPVRSASELVALMPPAAVTDMMEWGPAKTPVDQFALALSNEKSIDDIIARSPDTAALADDRPINEYFLLRAVK
ncbi:MAG TPA: fused MFS/spermidine synthase [Terracidiphilus sp.]|jgi:predicted membrane-bound spermidine synthase|nr:fused MFS/spermidine synthase [Terracidiphilus sp.]